MNLARSRDLMVILLFIILTVLTVVTTTYARRAEQEAHRVAVNLEQLHCVERETPQ